VANIRERGGKYSVQVRLQGVVENKTFTSREDAVAWAASVERNVNTSHVGLATELSVMAKLTKNGLNVLRPIGVCRYDMVYEKNGQLKKVQIKTASKGKTKNSVLVPACSINNRTYARKTYDKADVDELMFMYKDNLYVVPIEDVQTKTLTFRTEEASNNQKTGVRYLKDYLYE